MKRRRSNAKFPAYPRSQPGLIEMLGDALLAWLDARRKAKQRVRGFEVITQRRRGAEKEA